MNAPHKWQKEIVAWANNPKLRFQFRGAGCQANCWYDMTIPDWSHSEIRIKPEKKPDVILYGMHNPKRVLEVGQPEAKNSVSFCLTSFKAVGDSVKYTFDGDTGSLKSVEKL